MNTEEENEALSEDPEENLRIENELTRIKMQAEMGAVFGGDMSMLPPEVEKQFLDNIARFEESWNAGEHSVLRKHLGMPELKPVADLSGWELETAWEQISALLKEKQVELVFEKEYPLEEKYRFVTEDLMEVAVFPGMPEGMLLYFCYEEFYPDHKALMDRLCREFLEALFRQKIVDPPQQETIQQFGGDAGDDADEDDEPDEPQNFPQAAPESDFDDVVDEIVTADQRTLSLTALQEASDDFHAQFSGIAGFRYNPKETSFTEPDETQEGSRLGHVQGMVHYTVLHEGGEEQVIEGPFKLYMENKYGGWRVFYFVLPGWVW